MAAQLAAAPAPPPAPPAAVTAVTATAPLLPLCGTAVGPEPWAVSRETSELETRRASALLEQDEACFSQHPLLSGGQATTGLPSGEVADYRNDLDQIP